MTYLSMCLLCELPEITESPEIRAYACLPMSCCVFSHLLWNLQKSERMLACPFVFLFKCLNLQKQGHNVYLCVCLLFNVLFLIWAE
jgi:hypothetical protein